MDYGKAYALQESLAADISNGHTEETLLLLQHPSVYTIGRGGLLSNILDPAIQVERVNRGGDVTWHGPGQLVGYPLINLTRRGRDLHRWIGFLEELLVDTLDTFGIRGQLREGARGVWTKQGKIAFLGVGVRRWVTMHGFSLNVSPELHPFDTIIPCGIAECPITSMAAEGLHTVSVDEVKNHVLEIFEPLLQSRLPKKMSR